MRRSREKRGQTGSPQAPCRTTRGTSRRQTMVSPRSATCLQTGRLVALTTFSDLVGEAMDRVQGDAAAAGLPDDGRPLRDGGTGADCVCRGGSGVSWYGRKSRCGRVVYDSELEECGRSHSRDVR